MMKAAQSNQGLSNDDQEGRKQIVEPADDKGILKTDIDSEQNKEHNVGRRRIAIGSVIICVLVVTVVGSIVGATVSRKKKEKDEDFLSANSNSLREVPQGIFDTDDEEIPNQKITVSGEVEVIKDDISGSFTEENSTTLPPSNTAADQVWNLLLDNAIYGGIEFQDPILYQSKAVEWVLRHTVDRNSASTQRILQRYALACLYYATNGVSNPWTEKAYGSHDLTPGWIDERNWLTQEHECSWYKVSCDGTGFVKSIQLYSNRLSGALPAELKLLKDTLEEIDLYKNLIYNSGDAGHDWLGELTNLRRLYYGSTYFEYDGIPHTIIGKLTNLEEYDCSYCLYNGSLTEDLFSSNLKLNYLHISGNNYNSSIPSKLASLPNLEYLYVEDAGLTGDLSFVTDLSVVAELWIGRNPGLKGTVPSEIGELSSLRSLSLNSCSLTGTLSMALEMTNLRALFLEDNNLTGTMPEGICENVSPDGFLGYLSADCLDEIICDCCTCCGPNCYSSSR